MIIVKNRKMVVPYDDMYIGTTYDDDSERRIFRIDRYAQNERDLSALTFRLDIKQPGQQADTVILDKDIDERYIYLIWNITNSVIRAVGLMFVQIRAIDNEATVKWSTYDAALYVARHLNTPGSYTGSLTEIEQMEQDHQYMKGVVDELKSHLDYTHEAEAWAIGKRDGEDVPSTDETYHNNSKYYSEQAGASATAAANSATAAAGSATQAAATVADTNTRFNNAVAAVTVNTEVQDARVGADGTTYTVLKNRLDAEHTDVKSALNERTESVVETNTTGQTVATWAGLAKTLVVQKGFVSGKAGRVSLSCYNHSIHSSWQNIPFIFVLLYEESGNMIVADKISVSTPSTVGPFTVKTPWVLEKTKKYYVGIWRENGSYISYVKTSQYGTYTKAIWTSASEITVGQEIAISSFSNAGSNTILLDITLTANTGIDVPEIQNEVDAITAEIEEMKPEPNKVTDFSMETASIWAGLSNGIAILDKPIFNLSGRVELSVYNPVMSAAFNDKPYVFVLYERTETNTFVVTGKKIYQPERMGENTVDTGWTITDDKLYYIGVYRAAGNWAPYINGGISTLYKASAYASEADITVGSTIDLSSLSYADNNTVLVNIRVAPDGKHIVKTSTVKRMVHFSVDDSVFWSDLIENENVYESCFENPQLKIWKYLYDLYGVRVTMNCFCSDGTRSITNVPSKFAEEFKANCTWLKFAFHAQDSDTYYSTDKVSEITASYNMFVDAIINMTGTADAIDPVTRLGSYTGTLANVLAIRDADCGITGLLTSDDNRTSYYLDNEENEYILSHNRIYDAENHLLLIHTMPRLEGDSTSAPDIYTGKTYKNKNQILEFFTHENVMNAGMRKKIERYCNWSIIIGADFDFASNWMPGIC